MSNHPRSRCRRIASTARASLRWFILGPVLLLGGVAAPAHGQGALAPRVSLLSPGLACGFLADCTRFAPIGLHVATAAAVQTDTPSSRWELSGGARLALTALDLAEVGVAFAGRLRQAPELDLTAHLLPVSLYARLRLLPLPLRGLALAPFRLGLGYQHELVSETFGGVEQAGAAQGTLRLLAGQRLGRLDVDGGLGVSLMREQGQRPRAVALELSALASLWLWGGTDAAPSDEFRLTAEALVRLPIERAAAASEQKVLLGFLGQSPRGYGGGVCIGAQVFAGQPGLLILGRVQVSWGKAYQNPWAERKAAEPQTTPAFIWGILGAIDPVVGREGCVWTDPSPQRPATRWFCIGKPDAQDPSQVVLKDGKRVAVGTHLWELHGALRLDEGNKLVEIPLEARLRKAVWDYLDEHQRQHERDEAVHRQQVCARRAGLLHGLDEGTAAMMALDDFGGPAAMLATSLVQQIYCDKDKSPQEQALGLLGAVAALRGHGPLRARMPLRGAEADALAGEAPAGKARGGAPSGGVAEHTVPPGFAAANLPAQTREHLLHGTLNPKDGRSTGWHYEPTGSVEKGTYVIPGTRSAPDIHGVFEANVMIQGVKKGPKSSFFPSHWTIPEIETAIEEAYRNRKPEVPRPGGFTGYTARGLEIKMDIDPKGRIQTAYPMYRKAE